MAYLKTLDVAPAESMNELAGLYELAKSNATQQEGSSRSDVYLLIDSLRSSLQDFQNTGQLRDI